MRTSVLLLLAMAGCGSATDNSVIALATRLADENGSRAVPSELREAYIACGAEALSTVAAERIGQAMKAPDAPAIWAILGTETLDNYVAICRKAEQEALGQSPEATSKRIESRHFLSAPRAIA